ncbi:MAG: hypothetical protein H0A75_04045 [Candidatus Methanofishera endochildressiae]|uniref:Uncharacterized protein n=1 Tax=Candidatus Methanofishera endochildressiae TaxID=2738884 RepID=A0A7Z0SDG0_9GAMM|nr:hypothetical protein [Candidatus Methanofishera endochildressiae]
MRKTAYQCEGFFAKFLIALIRQIKIQLEEGENVAFMQQLMASKTLPDDGRVTDRRPAMIFPMVWLVRGSNTALSGGCFLGGNTKY